MKKRNILELLKNYNKDGISVIAGSVGVGKTRLVKFYMDYILDHTDKKIILFDTENNYQYYYKNNKYDIKQVQVLQIIDYKEIEGVFRNNVIIENKDDYVFIIDNIGTLDFSDNSNDYMVSSKKKKSFLKSLINFNILVVDHVYNQLGNNMKMLSPMSYVCNVYTMLDKDKNITVNKNRYGNMDDKFSMKHLIRQDKIKKILEDE